MPAETGISRPPTSSTSSSSRSSASRPAVKPTEGGLEVTGDLTMHGETKPVTFTLKGGNKAEFPKGVKRTGYATDLMLSAPSSASASQCPPWGMRYISRLALRGPRNKRAEE